MRTSDLERFQQEREQQQKECVYLSGQSES